MSSAIWSMPSKRPLARLRDIHENIKNLLGYTHDMTFADFQGDRMVRDACERCLERISEAGVKLGDVAEERLPNHPWHQIRGMGNILRHDYDRVLPQIIWDLRASQLPMLLRDVEEILAIYPEEQDEL